MKTFPLHAIALLFGLLFWSSDGQAALREVIVSHTDEKGVLQLYRMKEDGTNSRQLTFSKNGCRMPSCSPDGTKLAYVEQIDHGLAIRISDLDGRNVRTLVKEGMNLTRNLSLMAPKERLRLVQDEHLAIVEAIAEQDGERAEAAMRSHIDKARHRMFEGTR